MLRSLFIAHFQFFSFETVLLQHVKQDVIRRRDLLDIHHKPRVLF